MRKRVTSIAGIVVFILACSAFVCTTGTFERTTYNSLATSKAAIDSAAAQYNSGAIAQTQQAHDIIAKAQQAQNVAVDAFKTYLYTKAGTQAGDVQTAQANVNAAIASLAATISDVQSMVAKGGAK
jgi:hypothetical protein